MKTPLLGAALALAALGGISPTMMNERMSVSPGLPLGLGQPTATTFTDSRGRKYQRDEKGTIRRLR